MTDLKGNEGVLTQFSPPCMLDSRIIIPPLDIYLFGLSSFFPRVRKVYYEDKDADGEPRERDLFEIWGPLSKD